MRNPKFLFSVILLTSLCISSNSASNSQCGKIKVKNFRVANGIKSFKGQWPWLVSLHVLMVDGSEKFFCGASLINEWTLVTAAHCVTDKAHIPRSVVALFGRLNLTDETESDWVKRNLSAIKVHEDYLGSGRTFGDSDIAVLILSEPVEFNDFIQPICLPDPTDDVINITGIVVGYGNINENSGHQEIPSHARLSTIDPFDCLWTNRQGPNVVSLDNNFCAKSDQSVPCVGDSGGPFVGVKNGIFRLLGVVSYAFNGECSAEDYAVFDEVPKFVNWILKNSDLFYCKDGLKRIPVMKYCDAVKDCEDGSDEEKCVPGTLQQKDPSFDLLGFYSSPSTTTIRENFSPLTPRNQKVEGFYMQHDKNIKFLPIYVAEKLPNLKLYQVIFCSIENVSKINFLSLERLETLGLWQNEIKFIESDAFEDLRSLKELYLHANKLTNIDGNLVENCRNLNVIELNYNEISSIGEKFLENSLNLERFEIQKNELTTFSSNFFSACQKLEYIKMAGNQIQEIPENSFANLSRLITLDLNDNKISNLPTNTFKNSPNLSIIDLSENLLETLRCGVFNDNKNLTRIDLQENKIHKIEEGVFEGLEKLKEVNFWENECIDKKFGSYSEKPMNFTELNEMKRFIKINC